MRVTSNMSSSTLIAQLNKLTQQQTRLQSQASTGQRIFTPDDDPAATRRVITLQAQSKAQTQYLANVNTLKDRASTMQASLKTLKTVSDRASEIATMAGGINSSADLKTYATEVDTMIETAVKQANTQFGGDYVFGGTNTAQPPFTITRDADGWITGVAYQGNSTVPEVEIGANDTASVQVPGENETGAGIRGLVKDSRTGSDFFQHLINLQTDLRNGDTSSIANKDTPDLAKDEDNIIYHISATGTLQSRLDAAQSQLKSLGASIDGSISRQADSDLTTTLVNITKTQTAYQAALQSGAALFNKSLMDYLQ